MSLGRNFTSTGVIRPFQKRRAIACARPHTRTKVFGSVLDQTYKSNF